MIKDKKEIYLVIDPKTNLYFSGIRSKIIRWNSDFMKAKQHKKPILSDRDKNFLENTYRYGDYKFVKFEISLQEVEEDYGTSG